MKKLYSKWITEWETRLTTRDTNRVVRPLEWGMEWAHTWPGVDGKVPEDPADYVPFLTKINEYLVAHSEEFFGYRRPQDFRLEYRIPQPFFTCSDPKPYKPEKQPATYLRFTSPVRTPYPENDLVNARWFPAEGKRAVIVLPHWNADAIAYNALCRGFNMLGIAALRLSKPYHDIRRPHHIDRSDYAVSANVCRTIDAARQAVIDVRCCIDWLQEQGYERFAVLGTSLGSCYAFIAAAHEPRIAVNVFNHASTYFADVVWTGQSTRHIRQGMEGTIDLDTLRNLWLCISPMAYFDKFAARRNKSLVIYAKHDLTFLPELSEQVIKQFAAHQCDFQWTAMPCGHYTIGEAPFKFVDGWKMVNFLRTALPA